MGVSFVLWAAGITRPCRFPISRRRGRCPHRPAGNGRFMAVFRRTRADFPFCTVGADDPVRPPETPVLRRSNANLQHFSVLRRRGRCPHRPARNARFMAVFRRTRADFPFCTVGADDSVRLPENARFYGKPMRNRNILMGRCGHRPLQKTSQNATFFRFAPTRGIENRVGRTEKRRIFHSAS